MTKPQKMTVQQFFARFPDDAACLEHIMKVRFGLEHHCRKCGALARFKKMAERPAFFCEHCWDHVYPCAGTVLQDTRTPLQSWFYAMYLFVTTRHGVSGKELQRVLGVTYKTAWRMGHQIRKLMDQSDVFHALKGHVEIDESYVGGHTPGKPGATPGAKTIVLGMKERGGRTVTQVIPNTKMRTIKPIVLETIEEGTTISTDELLSYGLLTGYGYKHDTIKHRAKEYVRGETHVNSIESFWKLFKHSVRGTHIHISPKHMDKYLREFTFRANHREKQNAMFDLLVASI
ncbi:MAG: IS1595 family transposase [Xanthobacteraceae bacterium]|nr:IS1595 family transposase [Xanthobacteraceae bacterium]QYK44797.1 MAG: IS1595 family transposase [Xanthobacteraceae bacterium]